MISDNTQAKPLDKTAVMQSVILPNELRIGNLVECFGIREVVAVKKHKIKVQHESKHGNFIIEWCPITSFSLEPIPLTEEWIVKYGFNCINRPKMAFKLYHNNENADFSSLILKEVGNNPVWVYAGNNRWTINPFTVEIKYVHQLQNLFFFLAGRELTVA